MAANIEIAFDESTLGRVYTWLLSLNDESPTAGKPGVEKVSEIGSITTTQAQSDDTAPEDDQS